MIDRLTLNEQRIQENGEGLREVAQLPDRSARSAECGRGRNGMMLDACVLPSALSQ